MNTTTLHAITDYLDRYLRICEYLDIAQNGLQVDASVLGPGDRSATERYQHSTSVTGDSLESLINLEGVLGPITTAVDCGLEVIERATALSSPLLIVHHGLFWKHAETLTGVLGRSVKRAMQCGLSIYGAHLPLDGHLEHGNGALLARHMGLNTFKGAFDGEASGGGKGVTLGVVAENLGNFSMADLGKRLATLSGGIEPLILPFGPAIPKRVLVLTGAGASALTDHQRIGFDTLVTGEPRQFAYHYAKDHGLNVLFGGHYWTETLGVKALGGLIEERFKIPSSFIDIPTGI